MVYKFSNVNCHLFCRLTCQSTCLCFPDVCQSHVFWHHRLFSILRHKCLIEPVHHLILPSTVILSIHPYPLCLQVVFPIHPIHLVSSTFLSIIKRILIAIFFFPVSIILSVSSSQSKYDHLPYHRAHPSAHPSVRLLIPSLNIDKMSYVTKNYWFVTFWYLE